MCLLFVSMVRYEVVLRGAYPLKGPFYGGPLKNETFLGSEMATSKASALPPSYPTYRYIVEINRNLKGT
jgi:hypothetical protein